MAMLAEPRRKTKWSLNPRGKDWSQDSSKFGQKILEKMGWSSGKGLGANLDGTTDHIKVSYKNDSKGMGFKEQGDQWTEHETQFNSLLKSLEGSENSNDSGVKEEEPKATGFGYTGFQQSEPLNSISKKDISGVSLEEKSKKSRARVHYHKFTRGKDISKYSAKDLANIFGKKTLATPEPVEAPKMNYGVVKIDEPREEPAGLSFGIPTTQSSQSIADYFKSKMPSSYGKSKYKVGHNGVLCSVKDNEQETGNVENGFCGFNMESKNEDSTNLLDNETEVVLDEENIKKSKKKKKKSKKCLEEAVDLKETENIATEESCKPEESEKQKKKKKRKAEEVEVEISVVSEEQPIKKKKKKSKDLDKIIEQEIVVKKSKKRKAEIDENEENLEKVKEENVVNNDDELSKPKKKKKKSKKHDL